MTAHKDSDEFDALVVQSLQAQVDGKHPPRRVWRRIRAAITDGSPRLPRWRWSMAAQIVVTVLVIFSGRLTLETNRRQFVSPTKVYTPLAVTHPESHTEAVVINPERRQLRALKSPPPPTPHVVATPPLNLPPTDVVRLSSQIVADDPPPAFGVDVPPPPNTGGVFR